MRKEDINIRDPYVLLFDNKYYMYGTRGETAWSEANGFDVFISEDFKRQEIALLDVLNAKKVI